MKTKAPLLISFLLTATLLFGCNTALPAADPTPEQVQLPTPNVESIPVTEPPTLTDIPPNEESSLSGDCQLALDIPWEHDENNPITDENQIMEILRALGNLEECLFARQDGWLHYYVLQNGQRTEEEVLVHLTDGGRYVDLRYFLFYDQGQYTAELYYDGRTSENQWCNISDDANKQVIQVERNCKTTEVYHLLTGNNEVSGYVSSVFYTFLASKKFPDPAPGYYLPRIWFTQENDASFLVIESKYDMSDVQGGIDPFDAAKLFTDEVRRHMIDLGTGRLTRYIEETGFKDGSFRVLTEDVFLLFYPELPDEIAAALSRID